MKVQLFTAPNGERVRVYWGEDGRMLGEVIAPAADAALEDGDYRVGPQGQLVLIHAYL